MKPSGDDRATGDAHKRFARDQSRGEQNPRPAPVRLLRSEQPGLIGLAAEILAWIERQLPEEERGPENIEVIGFKHTMTV